MKVLNASAAASLALLSAVLVLPCLQSLRNETDSFSLAVTLTAAKAGHVQVFWDDGSGISEANSSTLEVPAGGKPVERLLHVPNGVYTSLRLDPMDNDGTVRLYSSRIVDGKGQTVRGIASRDFSALNQIRSLGSADGALVIETQGGDSDPQLLLHFEPRLVLYGRISPVLGELAWKAALVFVLLAAVLVLLGRRLSAAFRAAMAHPRASLAAAAAVSVCLSALPVVLGNRSYVSPNTPDMRLLYDRVETLPGFSPGGVADVKGSDVGAVFWQDIPYAAIEHRALLRDFEFPLWDRYNSCGAPLLGEGQSMFGDPLHLPVMAANSAAWAWDATYLGEKWIFALGLGLLVLACTRSAPAALIVTAAAPFFGFFVYRFNHPAFFSLCTAPWVLYSWLRLASAPSLRSASRWGGALILANLSLMNSGTVKEAYMLLLAMNFSGACVLLSAGGLRRETAKRMAVAAASLALFVMIGAPVWLTFLETLRGSYTSYDAASAFQIQPSLLLGLFDEALYRPLTHGELVFNPSVNFIILSGMLYFGATLRSQLRNPVVAALAVSSLLPLSLAFGLVPPSWIVQVPFLRNVAHIDNCFSCALVIVWSVLAGVGFAAAIARLGTDEGKADLKVAGAILFFLVLSYLGYGHAVHRSSFAREPVFSALRQGDSIPMSLFVRGYLASILAAAALAGLLARRWLLTGRATVGVCAGLLACAWAMSWRQALQFPDAAFEGYTIHPGPRTDLHARSAAMGRARARQSTEPGRGVGLEATFFPGWSGIYAVEGISGPDALMNPYYRELTGVSPLERIWDWRLYLARERVGAVRPFLDFLNVRYYFGLPGEQLTQTGLRLAASEDLDTYVSPTAWPRAFFSDRAVRYDQPSDVVQLVMKGDGQPFAAFQGEEAQKLSNAGIREGLGGRVTRAATDYVLTERTTSFKVHATSPGVIVLNEVYWRDYAHAEVNGARTEVIRANHAFQGVLVDRPGDFEVKFSYEPEGFDGALALAGAGLAATGMFLWALRRSTAPLGSVHLDF